MLVDQLVNNACFFFLGCDPKKYHDKRDQMEDTHRQKVQDLLQQWQQAEKRYKLLKSGDENQATGAVAGKFLINPSTLTINHKVNPIVNNEQSDISLYQRL